MQLTTHLHLSAKVKNNRSCTFPPIVWLHGVNRDSPCLLALLHLCLTQLETFRKYWIVSFIYILRFSGQWLSWLWSCGSWLCVVLLGDVNVMESSGEITNKMQPCNRIYYSTVHWRLNMFWAAHRLSSGALTVFAASGLHTHLVTGSSQVWVPTRTWLLSVTKCVCKP
jgi:hypothetical protein